MFDVLILAGGMATRLYPITKTIPKSLIKINNKTFIEYQLRYLDNQGIKKVVISTGKFAEKIEEKVYTIKNLDLKIEFMSDGKSLLGTGGAIKNCLNKLRENFFVMYGDSYLPVNFQLFHDTYISRDKLVLMTVYKNNNMFDKSNILFSNNKILKYDKIIDDKKMQHIDYGLSIISKNIFKNFNMKSKFDLSEIFKYAIVKDQLTGVLVKERFYEIGSKNGIDDFRSYAKSKKFKEINS